MTSKHATPGGEVPSADPSAKVILVCGHGPGISDAVARRFAKAGFVVGLVGRNKERLRAAVEALTGLGAAARAFPCNLADPEAVRAMLGEVRASLGSISVIHWNPYAGGVGDLMTSPVEDLDAELRVSVLALVATVQEALPDLRQEKGALLVTGGGLGFHGPQADQIAVSWNTMGFAVAKAAQHKTVGLLHQRLATEDVYVGEVVVLAPVKGTPSDPGNATLEPAAIAEKFWELYQSRKEATVTIQ